MKGQKLSVVENLLRERLGPITTKLKRDHAAFVLQNSLARNITEVKNSDWTDLEILSGAYLFQNTGPHSTGLFFHLSCRHGSFDLQNNYPELEEWKKLDILMGQACELVMESIIAHTRVFYDDLYFCDRKDGNMRTHLFVNSSDLAQERRAWIKEVGLDKG